ncbi:hypothetical protein [Roseibacillus persicicus]|uniref:hypothetical protein n=1 Tax=Roseibacillus persicicus TaxID=454148 RepID=UPI00281060D3|nr:hypothetical protein [Roseibacillus persicicus]MDQ8189663.1 hypothetical protein [Roseibacillus persicicus]
MKVKKEVFQELGAFLLIGAAVCAVLILASCSTGPVAPAPASESVAMAPVGADGSAALSGGTVTSGLRSGDYTMKVPTRRPGLGTGWGDTISSSLNNTQFIRESNQPFGGVGMIYYNDQEGINAMAGSYKNKTSAYQRAANGAVEWGVKSGWSTPDHYMSGSKRYVVGKKGRKYSLVVRNVSDSRLEVVLSVDGLDVMDGKAASFKKRGYIIAPGEKIEVKGFRTSYDTVATFEFSTVGASYSNLRHGQTRDIGVIGLAVFAEKGSPPWRWATNDASQRGEARPFAEAPLRTVR